MTSSSSRSSRSVYWIASSSVVVVATWRLLQWRARKRVRNTVQRVEDLLREGPLIDYHDPVVRQGVLTLATRRASKWISLSRHYHAKPMVGQVGGITAHRRPVLSLKPDYILKPLPVDHRGIRELAFYQAMAVASSSQQQQQQQQQHMSSSSTSTSTSGGSTGSSHHSKRKKKASAASATATTNQAYSLFLTGRKRNGDPYDYDDDFYDTRQQRQRQVLPYPRPWMLLKRLGQRAGEVVDTVAVAWAMLWHDPVVTESEEALERAWKNVKKEVDALRRLAEFTAPYYGLVERGRSSSSRSSDTAARPMAIIAPFGITEESHLLLHDLTESFSKPCVIDLKMGSQSYEPDAPADKRKREEAKYPQQELYGFRIVGMRFYDPEHVSADEHGYRCFGKEYGRSLTIRDDLLEALHLFFSAGIRTTTRATTKLQLQKATSASAETIAAGNGHQQKNEVRRTPTNNYHKSASTTTTTTLRTKSIANLVLQVRSLRRWFEENGSSLRFYASSLLIIYEGDVSKTAGEDSGLVSLKMIDFGHVRRQGPNHHQHHAPSAEEHESSLSTDRGYRLGLRTLHHLLDDILQEEQMHDVTMSPLRRQSSQGY